MGSPQCTWFYMCFHRNKRHTSIHTSFVSLFKTTSPCGPCMCSCLFFPILQLHILSFSLLPCQIFSRGARAHKTATPLLVLFSFFFLVSTSNTKKKHTQNQEDRRLLCITQTQTRLNHSLPFLPTIFSLASSQSVCTRTSVDFKKQYDKQET